MLGLSIHSKSSFSMTKDPPRFKPDFIQLEVGYITITPGSVKHVNDEVRTRRRAAYSVVSNDGIPIVDTPGTRG